MKYTSQKYTSKANRHINICHIYKRIYIQVNKYLSPGSKDYISDLPSLVVLHLRSWETKSVVELLVSKGWLGNNGLHLGQPRVL